MVHHPVVALFPDRLTHGGSVDDWRRLAGLCKVCVCVCFCVHVVSEEQVCCVMSALDERFHVSSTVTVRTSAIQVSPSTSMQQAPSTKTKDTVNHTDVTRAASTLVQFTRT